MIYDNGICVIFDLDDTLYKEIDYLKSAYREIALLVEQITSLKNIYRRMYDAYLSQKDVFQMLVELTDRQRTKEYFIQRYRNHVPDISLNKETKKCLDVLRDEGAIIGLITDGRSVTQRNKIEALGLNQWIDNSNIIISEEFGSEKPSASNYLYFENKYPQNKFVYVGDNIKKDFIAPNVLKWNTICLLDNGQNIHKQCMDVEKEYLPNYSVNIISDILNFI